MCYTLFVAKSASGCGADGSALPWGGRGRWFKSSHSDQKMQIDFGQSAFFILKASRMQDPKIPEDFLGFAPSICVMHKETIAQNRSTSSHSDQRRFERISFFLFYSHGFSFIRDYKPYLSRAVKNRSFLLFY